MSPPPRLEVEEVGDVTVASFVDRVINDEQQIQVMGEQLFSLVDEQGRRKVLLNFGNVEYFSSAAHGKLITLQRKLRQAGGRLVLCGIDPELWEAFVSSKMSLLHEAYQTEEEALRALSGSVLRVHCPLCPGSARGLVNVPGSEASFRCLGCDARFGALVPEVPKGGSAEAVVVRVSSGGTATELAAGPPFTLTVGPRLDLYVADALKPLFLAVPPPRRVLIDCSSTKEWSTRGVAVLVELVRGPGVRAAVVVAPGTPSPPGLPDDLALCRSPEEALPILGPADQAERPIMVKVTRWHDLKPPAG
jgi:anti-sigma B factor antagonist